MTSYLDSPVFLCGHRKSGTTALLGLFDNHPETLTYPADSGFFFRVFPACEHLSIEETIDLVIRHPIRESLGPEGDAIGRLLAADEMPDTDIRRLFDVDAIVQTYRSLALSSDGSPASHLKSLMQAYATNCGQDSASWSHWVEKTTSTEIYAVEVAEWFPKAKFIHLVRDPRDNYASLKSGWQGRYQHQEDSQFALLQSLLDRGGLGLRMASTNQEALGPDRYMVLRFEDLVENPAHHMAAIAEFVGIAYHPTLETPTVNGVPWPGNNFDGMTFKGLSAVNVGRWHERIEGWEVSIIEGQLGDAMDRFDYKLSTSPTERAKGCIAHYKWFNFLPGATRGEA
jgi:hypothetical protein